MEYISERTILSRKVRVNSNEAQKTDIRDADRSSDALHRAGAGIGCGERKPSAIQINGGSVIASSGNPDHAGIDENLEYAYGSVISNGEALAPNTDGINYDCFDEWRY